jgi:hypothetical protein
MRGKRADGLRFPTRASKVIGAGAGHTRSRQPSGEPMIVRRKIAEKVTSAFADLLEYHDGDYEATEQDFVMLTYSVLKKNWTEHGRTSS